MSDGGAPESSTASRSSSEQFEIVSEAWIGVLRHGMGVREGEHQCKKRYCKMASLGWIAKQRKSGESAESALGLRRESGGTERKCQGLLGSCGQEQAPHWPCAM